MPLQHIPLKKISRSDLENLIENKVAEGKTIEYKRKLPVKNDESHLEYLKNVSSFSNSDGGDIIYGMKEERGTNIAKELSGVENENYETERSRLLDWIRYGVSPFIPGVDVQKVDLENSSMALVLRIPKSYNAPHIITYKDEQRFYSRKPGGRFFMPVDEIRNAFLISESIVGRAREFKNARINLRPKMSEVVAGSPLFFLHLLPLKSFSPSTFYDLRFLSHEPPSAKLLNPIGMPHPRSRYNFDGYLRFCRDKQKICRSITQLFTSGIVEHIYCPISRLDDSSGHMALNSKYEPEMISAIERSLGFLENELRIPPPIFVFLTMTKCEGLVVEPVEALYSKNESVMEFMNNLFAIKENHLDLPELLIDDYNCNLPQYMKNIFDRIWGACGWPWSMNYREDNTCIWEEE